jgi:hypothetical protein
MNLPVVNSSQFQVFSRNPQARRDFRESWGAKTEGIKGGDYIDGIILGFEIDKEFGSKHIILKSFQRNGAQVLIWGCSSIQNELHIDEFHKQMLYTSGDVVRITYKGSYVGKKGRSKDKLVAIFTIDEIVGYNLTSQDVQEVRDFQSFQKKPVYVAMPDPVYQQVQQIPLPYQHIQSMPQHQPQQNQTSSIYVQEKVKNDNSFDL